MDEYLSTTTAIDDDPSDLATPCRHDGWTDFARRLFLEVLSETGRVSRACEYAQLSPQSAYALRNRDPLFAAGWDAACALARAPLADALREQAIDGLTETIRRGGEIVAERHRHDPRLSIAVLHRLDKRCDRAEEQGAAHLALIARWDEWLGHVGKGDEQAALALLESANRKIAPDHQLHQLPLPENPTEEANEDEPTLDFWEDDDEGYLTNFPPPADFDGDENGEWGDPDYSRTCTEAEVALLDCARRHNLAAAKRDADDRRDAWLARVDKWIHEREALLATPPSA